MKVKLLFILLIVVVIAVYFYINIQSKNIISNGTTEVSTIEVAPDGQPTEVIDYAQTYIPDIAKPGRCWTTSIATPSNDKAWRCMTEDFIYDPCFEVGNDKVVCDVDPEKSNSGFTLNLTEKLPIDEIRPSLEETHVWMYKLSPDTKCIVLTGTAAIIDGILYYYVCENDALMVGDVDNPVDKTKQPWQATLVYPDDNQKVIKKETVSVLRVWR